MPNRRTNSSVGAQVDIKKNSIPYRREGRNMLVLSRKKNEKIILGDSIEITIVRVSDSQVRLGIQAPSNVTVLRTELADKEPPTPKS
jgi:carbon storage regulator CsrA